MRLQISKAANLDRALISDIIREVKPPGVTGFDVRIKCGRIRGWAYTQGCTGRSLKGGRRNAKGRHVWNIPYVVVYIPAYAERQGRIYHRSEPHKGYLGVTCYTRTEACVYILAHELRHLWQARVKKGHRVWGARGQYSERDADAYAIGRLRQWRRRMRNARNSKICTPPKK